MAGHGSNGDKFTKRPTNVKKTLSRLLAYFARYKFQLIVVTACIALNAAAGITGTALLQPLLDDYIMPAIGKVNPDLSGFVRQLIIMGSIYLVGVACSYIQSYTMMKVSSNILCNVRNDMFNHMQDLPIGYFDGRTNGEIMSRYTNDTDTMREMMSQSVPQIINSLIRVVGVFVMMCVLSPALTVLTLVMLGLMLLTVTVLGKRSGMYFRKRQASIAKINGYMEEMIEGQRVVKVFSHEQKIGEEFAVINEEVREDTARAHAWASSLMPIMGNLSYVHYAVTAMVGALLVALDSPFAITLGALASFLLYTRNFSQPITQLSQQFNSILSAMAGAERIFSLIDEPVESDEGSVRLVYAKKADDGTLTVSEKRTGTWAWQRGDTLTELRGDVRFNDVTFSYDGKKTVLSDVSLYAKPGQKIAFVGSTGAGKTTITNLINRFYDIHEGTITYDGIPITDIKKDDLRRSLAMVLQDTHLFTGTVMENIRYGKLDATDDEVIAAAKLANADYFIRHLPNGYDTLISADGAALSQGQRQLLAIARAAVADPPVLILDEATSSIDTRTEALIEKGMDKLMAGRTVFVIAHRLSTVRNSNAIMVLENGRIIERGDHDELLSKRGKYYQLYTGLFELN